ncbi:hypothetical protein PFISCL1PPCAC_13674, partial [Pristionchus fissidentatus]
CPLSHTLIGMSGCYCVQVTSAIFACLCFLFSIGACFIPLQNVEQWIRITLWVYGGVNAVCAFLVLLVLCTAVRYLLLPKVAIGIVNIAFFAFLLTLCVLTLCGTTTLIDEQIEWYDKNDDNFHDWITSTYNGSLERFTQAVAIGGLIATALLLVYGAASCYVYALYFISIARRQMTVPGLSDPPPKTYVLGDRRTSRYYDHSTLTGGHGPMQVEVPVVVYNQQTLVYGTSPSPYVD